MPTRLLPLAALFVAVAACWSARSGPQPSGLAPYRLADTVAIAHRVRGADYHPSPLAALVGLPPLATQRLPPRYRELRVEIGCGACVPEFLVRIIQGPQQRIHGEAFARWISADTLNATRADSAERRRLASIVRRDLAWETAWCAELARRQPMPQVPRYLDVSCRVRPVPDANWSAILAQLDSLGAFVTGSDTGYAPSPRQFVSADTVAGELRLSTSGGCSDIAGQHLILESLVDDRYRNAVIFCLERPRGDEAVRMAGLRRVALSAIPPRPTSK